VVQMKGVMYRFGQNVLSPFEMGQLVPQLPASIRFMIIVVVAFRPDQPQHWPQRAARIKG